MLALCSTPLEDSGFSVGVDSLSCFVPIIMSGTCILPLHDLAIQRCFQGPWLGHACIGLGRNKWHFPDFNGICTQTCTHTHTIRRMCTSGTTYCPFDPLTNMPAGCVPLGPHTVPLTPSLQHLYNELMLNVSERP
jgi:hypothetical protein